MWVDKEVSNKGLEEKIKERVAGKVDMQLGKTGVTEGFLRELKYRLEKHSVVKVRVLRSFRKTTCEDLEALANKLAKETGSKVYEIRGFTFILIKDK